MVPHLHLIVLALQVIVVLLLIVLHLLLIVMLLLSLLLPNLNLIVLALQVLLLLLLLPPLSDSTVLTQGCTCPLAGMTLLLFLLLSNVQQRPLEYMLCSWTPFACRISQLFTPSAQKPSATSTSPKTATSTSPKTMTSGFQI